LDTSRSLKKNAEQYSVSAAQYRLEQPNRFSQLKASLKNPKGLDRKLASPRKILALYKDLAGAYGEYRLIQRALEEVYDNDIPKEVQDRLENIQAELRKQLDTKPEVNHPVFGAAVKVQLSSFEDIEDLIELSLQAGGAVTDFTQALDK